MKEKIGVVGAGKIGAAIMRGIVRAGLAGKDQVMASDVSAQLRDAVVGELDVKATADNGELCDFADIIILAVKPQIVDSVAKEIAKKLGNKKLMVSVAAGVPIPVPSSFWLAARFTVVRNCANAPWASESGQMVSG